MQVMSSARAADSRHSKSLLQSRSLRDFRTPPHPSRPDKPRRRVLQVNGPHFVREPYPSVSGISEPSHAELVETPKNSSHSLCSSVQVSPFIAAPETSFVGIPLSPASSYESSLNLTARRPISPNGIGIHELRNPPVNPRKHRRLCSNFGLDCKEATVDISSLASTPLATYTETDSDSDISVHQTLDYSFPEPPPINEKLHLRRMHSSPMFDLEEVDQVKDILRKRWRAPVEVSKLLPAPYDHWDGTSSISIDSRYTSDLEDLDTTRSVIRRVTASNSSRNHFEEHRLGLASPPPPPPLPGAGKDVSWKRATTTTIPHDRRSETAVVSLSRTVSSVAVKEESSIKASVGSAAQRNFGRLPPELSESMDRLDLSIEKLKTHDPRQLPGIGGAVLEENRKKPEFRMSLSPPSLASAGRKKPVPRPYVSLPTFVAGIGHPSPSALPKISDHRAMRDQPVVPLFTHRSDHPMPRSFMDITPEREVERGPRSRVRKLLARASVSMFGWGKNVNRTKSISK